VSSSDSFRYGKFLSSRSRTLKGGRSRLMKFDSRMSASSSVFTTTNSTSAISETRRAVRGGWIAPGWKYDRTRDRSDFAFPT
jgi:hypothetical protein